MEVLVHLICIAVANFAFLAQPAFAHAGSEHVPNTLPIMLKSCKEMAARPAHLKNNERE